MLCHHTQFAIEGTPKPSPLFPSPHHLIIFSPELHHQVSTNCNLSNNDLPCHRVFYSSKAWQQTRSSCGTEFWSPLGTVSCIQRWWGVDWHWGLWVFFSLFLDQSDLCWLKLLWQITGHDIPFRQNQEVVSTYVVKAKREAGDLPWPLWNGAALTTCYGASWWPWISRGPLVALVVIHCLQLTSQSSLKCICHPVLSEESNLTTGSFIDSYLITQY